MPTTMPEGYRVPTGTDAYDLTVDLRKMMESAKTIVPVTNEAARKALVAALVADGRPPSAADPLYVSRADTPPYVGLEYTTDGTSWVAIPAETTGTLPLLAGYGSFEGAPSYARHGLIATASGGALRSAATTSIGASVAFGVASMPAELRPPMSKRLGVVASYGGPCTARYNASNGEIQIEYGVASTLTQGVWWVSLAGLSWQVAQ